jgi:hypothetical protein
MAVSKIPFGSFNQLLRERRDRLSTALLVLGLIITTSDEFVNWSATRDGERLFRW